jgi:plasmid stability protein
MKILQIPEVPDELYVELERRAKAEGTTLGAHAAELLARAVRVEESQEADLLAEIRAARSAMAAAGIVMTDEDLHDARNWGRR